MDGEDRTRKPDAASSGPFAGFLLPALFLLVFGGLEIHRAVDRIATEHGRRRGELFSAIRRQQERVVREISDIIGEGADHAVHLSRNPLVGRFLWDGGVEAREDLGAVLLPYLASFRGIDRFSVLDDQGIERFRCERMGGGVAVLPDELLRPTPWDEVVRMAGGASQGEPAISRLLVDPSRVEVSEDRRRVFHYVQRLGGGVPEGGLVVVTVYASPLIDALGRLDVVAGMSSWLLTADGSPFAAQEPSSELPVPLESMFRDVVDLAGGTDDTLLEGEADAVFVRSTGKAPCPWLVSRVPQATLDAGAGALGGEIADTLVRTVLVLGAVALGSAMLARAGFRARRLREAERYLARIQEESAKHRALMEAAADLILVIAPAGEQLRDSNPLARKVLGIPAEPTGLAVLRGAFGADGLEQLRSGILTAARAPGVPVVVPEVQIRSASGERLEVVARCVGLTSSEGSLVEVAISDRTREREMERNARTAERMSSLGLLTAGVAHEINNPLEGITNYLSLLERTSDEDRRTRYIEQVRSGLHRIRDIVGDLLRFAAPSQERGAADLARVVERVLPLARMAKDMKGVRVEVQGLSEPLPVAGGERRLEQVLLNLLLNAGRATGGLGTVWILADRTDADLARLVVEDDGSGFPEEDLSRAFDPFFTRSGGTGLGLSVSYGIVRAYGGELSAGNRSEGGARLTLTLPRVHAERGDGAGEQGR